MADVYNNAKGFTDFEFKISPDLYDEVLSQFQRFERDYPDHEDQVTESVKVLPMDDPLPHPPVFPKVKTRFFRMI